MNTIDVINQEPIMEMLFETTISLVDDLEVSIGVVQTAEEHLPRQVYLALAFPTDKTFVHPKILELLNGYEHFNLLGKPLCRTWGNLDDSKEDRLEVICILESDKIESHAWKQDVLAAVKEEVDKVLRALHRLHSGEVRSNIPDKDDLVSAIKEVFDAEEYWDLVKV